jgi:hypothetical protein
MEEFSGADLNISEPQDAALEPVEYGDIEVNEAGDVFPVETEEIISSDEQESPIIDYTVVYGDREFLIEEPNTETVIRLLNVVGAIGMRTEHYLGSNLKGLFNQVVGGKNVAASPPVEAMLFALLAVLGMNDIQRIGAIALFGGGKIAEDRGLAFFKELGPDRIKIAPIVKALAYRVSLSTDLMEALGNLQLVRTATTMVTGAAKT